MLPRLRPARSLGTSVPLTKSRSLFKFFAPAALLSFLLAISQAAGAEGKGGASEVDFLVQVLVLIVVGRVLGEVMQRLGQPAVMGQLLAGVLLGPSVLGALAPDIQHVLFPPRPEQKAMLNAVSELGILMLLLLTGMETNLELVSRVRRTALSISLSGIIVPFACGFALGETLPAAMLPHPEMRLITSLFLGTALSISSVKIVAMVVREMGFTRRNVGQLIIASAIIDDTIGWMIIAVTFSLALHGSVDFWALAQTLVGAALFLVFSFTLGHRFVFHLIRWSNDELETEGAVIAIILSITAVLALITNFIGVHTVLGAFVAGILIGQSPILTKRIEEQLRGLIVALFAPVFFGLAGLGADLTILRDPSMILLTAGLVAVASFGKFAGAFIGGQIGGISRAESLALACGMNARGSTEVIVATIGLSIGALSESLYTMIVAMAVLTTMAMPPMLRWSLSRLTISDQERERLARESFDEKGFVANLERLLIAADDSTNGQLAARVAGVVAGPRGMPVTVLDLTDESELESATVSVAVSEHAAQASPEAVSPEVIAKRPNGQEATAVSAEARNGYDLLIVGLHPALTDSSGFQRRLIRIADEFPGPVAITLARGLLANDPRRTVPEFLVPVTGTETSLRGADFAFALARGLGAKVTAIHIPFGRQSSARRAGVGRLGRADRAVIKAVRQLGEHYGVPVKTKIRPEESAESAILGEAEGKLIVMGVTRRPGDTLTFGHVSEAILVTHEQPVIFLMT
ncbi:MAG: sodium/hydrogen exchanger [Hyphomicrobiales bacterium]|nr:sodium/hydrogen exchanger [Hyphomicrobiales bacterium]